MGDTVVEGPDPLLGSQVVGRYTILRRIARGGMGVVYLAVQDGLGRSVALKIIRKEAAADPVMQKRFQREARAVSQLGHPAIVTVHDFGRCQDGSLFLAMELVDGEVLRDALVRKHRFTFAETLPIIETIASALVHAHGAGIVHRDLKPENIMLPRQSTTGSVHAKVLDFGLAKRHEPDLLEEHLTMDGGFVGTPGYASPEQVEGAPESPQQDLYALGIVWFELLSGEHPFSAPTPMKVVVRQLQEEPPSLPSATVHGSLADVPPHAIDLVRRLMARRTQDRPQTAHDVLAEIARMRAALSTAHDPSPHGSDPEAATWDGRSLPRRPLPEAARALAPVVVASVSAATPTPVHDVPPRELANHRGRARSNAAVVVILSLCAGALGALFIALFSRQSPAHPSDAGSLAANVDHRTTTSIAASEPSPVIQIVIAGVPTFRALQEIRALLPGSQLKLYTNERAVIQVDAASAASLADLLQGHALVGDVPLVLEVQELAGARVVLAAVHPSDASLDGGPSTDAGALAITAPGGLAP